MIEALGPEDNTQEDTDHHMNMWRILEQQLGTTDDRDLTQENSEWSLKISISGKHQDQTKSQAKL